MKRIFLGIIFVWLLTFPVNAEEFTAPNAPEDVQGLMPVETESFAQGVWKIFLDAMELVNPELTAAAGICGSLIGVTLLLAFLSKFPNTNHKLVEFVGCIAVGSLLLGQAGTLIRLGGQTVKEMSEYGKLLLPVLTAALAAQGGTTSSAALYAGTTAFDTILCSAIGEILVPLVYMFLALAIAAGALYEDSIKKLKDFLKWIITWCMKTALYLFTGYMGITRVITGSTDASALKAMKLTISGMVPVVGGILSDASEAVLLGAGVMKTAAGIYGLFALIAIWIVPFLQIGFQYLMLKLTSMICDLVGSKHVSNLISDFSTAMGILLGMTGTVCVLQFVSVVCFLKEVG